MTVIFTRCGRGCSLSIIRVCCGLIRCCSSCIRCSHCLICRIILRLVIGRCILCILAVLIIIRYLGIWQEIYWCKVSMYLIHVVLPYFCRVRASCQFFDCLRHIAAYPYTCGVVSGKATEPAVLLIVCGSGFAGARHAIVQISATSGS